MPHTGQCRACLQFANARVDAMPDASLYWQGEGATGAVWVDRGRPMTPVKVAPVMLVLVKMAFVRLAMTPSLHIDLASGLEYRHHLR